MICGDCGKKPATIRYTEMLDRELRTWQLCEDCARARGVGTGLTSIAGPLVNILMGLLEEAGAPAAGPDEPGPVCPQCGLSYTEFRATGRLGCGVCYESFAEELKPLLRRVHGSTEHVGRYPLDLEGGLVARRELRRMKAELDIAVRREDYERAAELRDLIRANYEEAAENGAATTDAGAVANHAVCSDAGIVRNDAGKNDVDV